MSEYYAEAQSGRGIHIEFSDGVKNAAIRASKGKCFYCRYTLDAGNTDVDHLVPASKGGGRDRENAKACCRSCNRYKADMDAVQFQLSHRRTPRCQNIVDEYDCENEAIEKSKWLRCTDCHGGTNAGDIALGVGIGVGLLGLAVGATGAIARDEESRRSAREGRMQNRNVTDAGEIALGVGAGVGLLGLAVGAAGALMREEKSVQSERGRRRQNKNDTDECIIS